MSKEIRTGIKAELEKKGYLKYDKNIDEYQVVDDKELILNKIILPKKFNVDYNSLSFGNDNECINCSS